MRDLSRKWIDYTNLRKQALEEAKKKEAEASATGIEKIGLTPVLILPELTVKKVERPANVNYSVSVKRMRRLAKELGSINLPYREVGIRSFEYTYDDLVGED